MRIALIVPGGVDRSGRERVIPALLWLIERLARQHDVLVVALHQEPEPSRYSLLGAQVVNLGQVTRGPRGVGSVQRLRRLMPILASNGLGFDVLHGFSVGEAGLLAGVAGRLLRVPVVVSVMGGELVWLRQIGYGGQRNWRSRARVRLGFRLANVVTAPSRYVQAHAVRRQAGTLWMPLGVDAALFDVPVARPEGPPWRLLQVASINHVKDPPTMFRALRLVADRQPAVQFDWVGQDTLDGAMQRMVASLGLSDIVTFHGFWPTDEIAPLYRRAHLYVQSSLHESQGVAVCEAAAAGVPTVGTGVGLVAEWAPDAALAVPVGDAKALANGILSLLADQQSREHLGRAAQMWVRKHDADWTARQLDGLYAQLCRSNE